MTSEQTEGVLPADPGEAGVRSRPVPSAGGTASPWRLSPLPIPATHENSKGETVTYLGVEGLIGYAVSSDGSVWSCRKGGRWGYFLHNWVKLKPGLDRQGYEFVNIGRKSRPVHTLVLTAFLGRCPNGLECRHVNGDKRDNRVINLQWGTRLENAQDKKRHGTQPFGEQHPRSVLREDHIVEIRKLAASKTITYREIAEKYNVSDETIRQVVSGSTWQHVGGPRTSRKRRRLTLEEIRGLVREYKSNPLPYAKLASQYAVGRKQIGLALSSVSRGRRRVRKLSDTQVRDIRLRARTESQSSLAREFGVSAATVCNIVKGVAYSDVK
jgi:hypothetical protein